MSMARILVPRKSWIWISIGVGGVMAACSGNEDVSTMGGAGGSGQTVGGSTTAGIGGTSTGGQSTTSSGIQGQGGSLGSTGGTEATGGANVTGGVNGTGGAKATGGTEATGGAFGVPTGGRMTRTGGAAATGGASMATGGVNASGGATTAVMSTGGRATGGALGTGGKATGGATMAGTGGGSCIASASGGPAGMNHGQACMGCHTGSNPPAGIRMTLAGTMYTSANSTTPVVGATVKVTGANGTTITMVTGVNGDFYSTSAITFPATVVASKCPDTQTMPAQLTNGNCNQSGCHSSGMRIHLP